MLKTAFNYSSTLSEFVNHFHHIAYAVKSPMLHFLQLTTAKSWGTKYWSPPYLKVGEPVPSGRRGIAHMILSDSGILNHIKFNFFLVSVE